MGRHASRDPAPPHGREDDREGSTSPRRWASGQTFGERAPTWTAGQPSPGPGERTTAWADIHPRPGPEEGTTAWADIIPVQTSGGKEARTWGNLPTPGLLSQGERPPAWDDINPRTYVSPPSGVHEMVRGRPPGPTCTNHAARGRWKRHPGRRSERTSSAGRLRYVTSGPSVGRHRRYTSNP